MKSGSPVAASLLPDLLQLLEAKTAASGLTPGQLRSGLARKGGVECNLTEVRALCHQLWARQEVVIEPPARGKKEYRVWHASHRKEEPGRAEAANPRKEAERKPPPGRRTREVKDGGEESFRTTFCGQLVAEWSRSDHEETREVLRRLLTNFGAERFGSTGEVLPFKGRRHDCDARVMPGDPVRVVEEGWVLKRDLGEYLLAKARVEAA